MPDGTYTKHENAKVMVMHGERMVQRTRVSYNTCTTMRTWLRLAERAGERLAERTARNATGIQTDVDARETYSV